MTCLEYGLERTLSRCLGTGALGPVVSQLEAAGDSRCV